MILAYHIEQCLIRFTRHPESCLHCASGLRIILQCLRHHKPLIKAVPVCLCNSNILPESFCYGVRQQQDEGLVPSRTHSHIQALCPCTCLVTFPVPSSQLEGARRLQAIMHTCTCVVALGPNSVLCQFGMAENRQDLHVTSLIRTLIEDDMRRARQ